MGGYLSAVKHLGAALTGLLLMVLMVAGCAVHKAETTTQGDDPGNDTRSVGQTGAQAGRKQVRAIRVSPHASQLEIWIQGSEPLAYTSIKQPFPFAVSVYLPDTEILPGVAPGPVDDSRVSSIRAGYADQEESTAKVEILLTRDLNYQVREDGSQIGIILMAKAAAAEMELPQPAAILPAGEPSATGPIDAAGAADVPSGPAEITGITFDTRPSGHSDIRITTSRPVRYETRQPTPDELSLILPDTRLLDHHRRPLLTRYFNSAVERVLPGSVTDGSGDARIDIRLREPVPFRVVRTASGIQMTFEPSSVPPPEFTKARKPLASGTEQVVEPAGPGLREPAAAADPGIPGLEAPRYAGEKIKLDFYETDIKNVFRILRSVSGLNFAVDSDVQGKVTLSLEEPVPWDQVLDLVLKMNGLGRKNEGNVVRIATRETLRKEEQLRQESLAAIKKAEEQKVALEPLFTEYIPINYSDATADVLPQVSQIITPDRGRVSVDTRTNTVILTDTREKIDQAQDLIFRLDQVTPQIMIEAKVVEVTKEFSRSFGLDWNLSNAGANTSGYIDDFNVSVNDATTGIDGNFSFFRLFGSSATALNVQLAASEELGDVKIISSPRILTLDNKKAIIKQGQEYAYLERDDTGGSSIAYKEIDLILEVTPHVTPDKRISMTVKIQKNDVARFIELNSSQVPVIGTNEAETELLVNNNETVVIGGVVKTNQTFDDDGIPVLRGMPLLGYLFATKTEKDNRNELLIFLTPSIVQLEQKRNVRPAGGSS